MSSRSFWPYCLSIVLVALLLVGCGSKQSTEANYPSKPIEVVTHNQPGAVMDVMGRLIADIVQQDKILPQPLTVVNKPASGGGEAFGYVLEKKGDPHTVLTMPATYVVNTPLTEDVPYTHKTFTPIANLMADGSLLFVSSDSPYKTMDDLIEFARKNPKKLNLSVTSMTSSQTMMARQVAKVKGIEWTYVTFASTPESILAVLNKTVDIGFANPATVGDHIRAGTVRPLMTGAVAKFSGELSAPLMSELGLGEPRVAYRGWWGPPEMPQYAVKKVEETLKKVMDSPRFKDYMDKNMMQPTWLAGEDFAKLLDKQSEMAKEDLAAAGQLKK
jgi:putative tricarboxylic transport membrane protein